jgi:hypothetical protein
MDQTTSDIKAEAPEANIRIIDLNSLESVRKAAAQVKKRLMYVNVITLLVGVSEAISYRTRSW